MTSAYLREAEPARSPRPWLALPVLGALAVVVVGALAAFDTVTVAGRAGMGSVEFGMPWSWIGQDLTSLDPPFPYDVAPSSPWEHPTSLAIAPFVLDVLVVFAVLAAAWLLTRTVRRRTGTPADRR